jgi:creatinine amidohydrolase
MDGKLNILEETMAHMTYAQIEEGARKGAIILFPTGVIEEHGPHLPLSVDVYGSYLQSRAIKKELEVKEIQALIAPPFYWGINIATGSFGGSFTSREETVVSVLVDAMASLKRWGFQRVFFVNHHLDSGHVQALDRAARKGRAEIGIEAFLLMDSLIAKRLRFKGDEEHILIHKSLILPGPPSAYLNIHAEAYETSFMWYYVPDLVNFEVWKTLKPTNLTLQDLEVWSKGGSEARKVTPQGYFGDPAAADPERGREEIETFGKVAAEAIETFLRGHDGPPSAGRHET